jgi:patatin-related protein
MTRSYRPEQEIRFAVVLYGGVSLAIYMNGIAQELLRMVRASADLDSTALSGTEKLYRRLAASIGSDGKHIETESDTVRSRFVIDIISGTSAGGINGVALAKALAGRNPDLARLENVWLEEADLGKLLNDTRGAARGRRKAGNGRTDALLNGDHMYGLVLDVLRKMNDTAVAGSPLTDKLDLFVTATDLEGLSAPIQLTGQTIDERIHKTVFHFEYEPNAVSLTNEFAAEFDGMLAFAARCTSSFPVAFEPMRFSRIGPHLRNGPGPRTLDEAKERYAKFFPAYLREGAEAFVDRPFADGGYLDNRPFSHAIGLIPFRATEYPSRRRLLFVDPFPEVEEGGGSKGTGGKPEISFVQNATLAAMTLPRYEVIREDIQSIHAYNRRLDRLAALQRRSSKDRRVLNFSQRPSPAGFAEADLADMVKKHGYGESYPLYHHLRVYDATDCLARIFTRIAGLEIDSDEYTYVRQLVRAWREANFNAYHTDGMRTENAFLDLYDTDFRLRRLNHLRSMIDDLLRANDASVHPHQSQLSDLRASVEVQIGRLRDDIRKLASRTRSPLLEEECLQELQKVLQTDKEKAAESYAAVMGATDREDRFERAKEVYRHADIKPHVDKLMLRIGEVMTETFDANREDMNARLPAGEDAPLKQVREAFQEFHWHDVLSLPFLEGSGAREHSEVQTFRISPAESSLNPSPNKLAGIALHAFGGFLDREWREHDILWGRLDGAERIIAALLPDPNQAALRKSYTDEAHEIILTETFAADGEVLNKRVLGWLLQRLEKRDVAGPEVEKLKANEPDVEHELSVFKNLKSGKDCRTFFQKQYEKPRGPRPDTVADLSSRAAKIFGRMIDDLPNAPSPVSMFQRRAATVCRSVGVLLATLLYFALPQSFARKLFTHWLALFGLAGALLVVVGYFTVQPVTVVGLVVVAGCLLLWLTHRYFGAWLRGQKLAPSGLRPAATVLVLLFVALGLIKAWELGSASPLFAGG